MEIILMSKKELRMVDVISSAVRGDICQRKAAEELNISLRQVKRLYKRVKLEGPEGIAHKGRGKVSNRKLNPKTRAEVLGLIKRDYVDFGPQLIKEQLLKRNNITLSREWIRNLMIEENIWEVKKRRKERCYQRRPRRSRKGELLQIDGSPHDWFEGRDSKCCLISMIDDATGEMLECRFVKDECLEAYFQGMKCYIEKHGRPLAVYSDRHTIFKSPKSEDKPNLTQFGRAMKELGIELIYANSPQAKGRVERSHGTNQDRLTKLMRLEGVNSMEEGNEYLKKYYMEEYNKLFGKKPIKEENAHRAMLDGIKLKRVLCSKEERTISKNLEVQYKCKTYQITSKELVRRLRGAKVMMLEVENDVLIEFEGKVLKYQIFNECPYEERVLDRKRVDAFIDKKKPMKGIERHRKGIAVNF